MAVIVKQLCSVTVAGLCACLAVVASSAPFTPEPMPKVPTYRPPMPDGPKVGSVALSPRGDWRMPSDADVALWLADLG